MAGVQADVSWHSMTCKHQIAEFNLTFEAVPRPTLGFKRKAYAFERSQPEPPEVAALNLGSRMF